MKTETRLVHTDAAGVDLSGATSVPIYQTATFDIHNEGGYDYSRSGNPTREVLEQQLAALESANASFVFNSGVSAVDAVLSLVSPGADIAVSDDLYGGTLRLLDLHARQRNVGIRYFRTGDPSSLSKTLSATTGLVLVEVPSNPFLTWTDVGVFSDICRRHGIPLAVDYSMLSPLLLQPLDLGADIAIQSATKLLGGHSDLTAGVVSVLDEKLAERLSYDRNARGTAAPPFESWLLLRGLKTLDVRLQRQLENTRKIVQFLESRDDVRSIYWPGTVDRARGCPVLTFAVGEEEDAEQLLAGTRLFRSTVSFGGVGSSICVPAGMSHACVASLDCPAGSLDTSLVRLSVGIESADDLIADLKQALDACDVAEPEEVEVLV